MEILSNIYFQSALALSGILCVLWYIADRVIRKNYHRSHKSAFQYVSQSLITKEDHADIGGFLSRVYEEATRNLRVRFDKELRNVHEKREALEIEINTCTKERDEILAYISDVDASDVEIGSSREERVAKLNLQINSYNKEIERLKGEVEKIKASYVTESSKKEEIETLRTVVWLESCRAWMKKIVSGFPAPLWFALLMLTGDYVLARVFFDQLFEVKSIHPIFRVILPILIVLVCMFLAERCSKIIEKIRKGVHDFYDALSLAAFGTMLMAIFGGILYVRLFTGVNQGMVMIVMQFLLSIIFITFVLIVSHLAERNKKNISELITTPAGLILALAAILGCTILIPAERFSRLFRVRKISALETELKKNIDATEKEIKNLVSAKSEDEDQLAKLPELMTAELIALIEDLIKIRNTEKKLRLDKLNTDIREMIIQLPGLTVREQDLLEVISEFRRGSDDGAMKAIERKSLPTTDSKTVTITSVK